MLKNKFIKIQVWDHGRIDGDIISVHVNGKEIISNYTLKRGYYEINCTLDENFRNDIILFAHNVGSISPNTAAIKIYDGYKNEQLILNATLGTSEAIVVNVN